MGADVRGGVRGARQSSVRAPADLPSTTPRPATVVPPLPHERTHLRARAVISIAMQSTNTLGPITGNWHSHFEFPLKVPLANASFCKPLNYHVFFPFLFKPVLLLLLENTEASSRRTNNPLLTLVKQDGCCTGVVFFTSSPSPAVFSQRGSALAPLSYGKPGSGSGSDWEGGEGGEREKNRGRVVMFTHHYPHIAQRSP